MGCFLFFGGSMANSDLASDFSGQSSEPEILKNVNTPSFWNSITNPFLSGVLWILYWILRVTLLLLAGAMWLISVMISPDMFNSVFFSPSAIKGITTGWSFVRDFFNLFFILIIVLVGLSVILGVGKFKDKTILIRVAFAAMLINFSKPITLFAIEISQVFMNFFANSIIKIDYASKMQDLIGLKEILAYKSLTDNSVFVVVIIFAIIMTLIMAIMLFYLAISLIIRMIAFWVLIILSPLAMFGIAMEGTKLGSLKDDWFENLTKWLLFGPILLFFMLLSLLLSSAISEATISGLGGFSTMSSAGLSVNAGGLSGFIVKVCGMLIPYITAVYLLFYGYDKAMKTSAGMASTILAAGNKKISEVGSRAKKIGWGVGRAATFPSYRTGVKEAVKDKVENYDGKGRFITRRLTKKGREDLQAEINAKTKNFFGDEGEAQRDYNQSKAQENLKKWKDTPPSENELKTNFESKDPVKKLSATLYKSQNNKIGSAEEYERAMSNLEGHTGLKERVEKETKKENLGAVIDYKINEDIKKAKKTGGSLHGFNENSNEYKDAINSLKLQKNQEEINKRGLKDIFVNQNKGFYLEKNEQGDDVIKKEVLEGLYNKALNYPKQFDRRKMANEIKNVEVINLLRTSGDKGRYILGDIG